jgi:PAS domain S-box-containing protein
MKSQFIEPKVTGAGRLAELLMLSHEPMLAWSLDGAIEFWNSGAERLYGFSSSEAVGRSSHALLQTRFPIDFAALQTQLRSARHWSGELRHSCKDRREVTVDSRMQLLGDNTVLEVNRDVTEIKELTTRQATLVRDLSAAAAKFEALFNQSGIFAGIMDLQGYLREVNKLAVEWCGYSRAEVLDRPFWDTPWWRGSEQMKARICFATRRPPPGAFFVRSLDTGWPTEGNAWWILRCIPSATSSAR